MDTGSPQRLAVVLIETRNPLNIGAAARAMSNFGFFDLRLVRPYSVAFEEAASAVGASAVLKNARVFDRLSDAVADCSLIVGATGLGHRVFHHPLLRLERAGRLLRRHLQSARAALLFGSEKFGLSNDDISHCHWLLHIPTRPGHDSMNLGQAVAVTLYELSRSPAAARRLPEAASRATEAEIARLADLLEQALRRSAYPGFEHGDSATLKLRHLLHRLSLGSRDAAILAGMLRQILWKLGPAGG
ncbi:MAG: tRNA (cytidine/uridine-2'-O-)-methyltransferase TrmJ [Bryobacteraceae bacterium]|nr:MAG: tRNA (cytidine/uridine-2'-O-)-methyltransferase TrmJ [Bryobacteraceae bacterium]